MIEVKLPKLGLTMETGTIIEIMVEIGQVVSAGDVLIEFETDKITGMVESPASGKVVDILVKEGDEVAVLSTVCVVEET